MVARPTPGVFVHTDRTLLYMLLQPTQGRTGLHQAAVKGDVDEVGFLLSAGANPNIQDAHLQVGARTSIVSLIV